MTDLQDLLSEYTARIKALEARLDRLERLEFGASASGSDHPALSITGAADSGLLNLDGVTQLLGIDDQNANLVFAGPAAGGATIPIFRLLVEADVPDLTSGKITDLQTAVSANGDVITAVNHVGVTSGNPHQVTAADVGALTQAVADGLYLLLSGSNDPITGPIEIRSVVADGAQLTLRAIGTGAGTVEFSVSGGVLTLTPSGSGMSVDGNISSSGATVRALAADTFDWIKMGDDDTYAYIDTEGGGPGQGHDIMLRVRGTDVALLNSDSLTLQTGKQLILAANPTAAMEAATKQYVDNQAGGGSGVSGFSDGSILFVTSEQLVEDNAHLFWDDANDRLGIGTNAPEKDVHMVGEGQDVELRLDTYANSITIAAKTRWRRARGTEDNPLPLQDGDTIGTFLAQGRKTTLAWGNAGAVVFIVDGTPSTAGVPGKLIFRTSSGGAVMDDGLIIGSDQNVELPNGVLNFTHTMGNGSDDPTTVAPAAWVEVQINGSTYYLPAYN